jgi:ketosteroid isomerase-like protein
LTAGAEIAFTRSLLTAIVFLGCGAAARAQSSPEAEIRAALTQWTDDFNAGHAEKVCNLFAPTLRADVRGAPERDFDTQCQLLRKALADPERAYAYAFALKEVVTERDMAVVRLTWTTTMRVKATGQVTTSFDEGLDVFGRGSDGTWRIIRYMAYERP